MTLIDGDARDFVGYAGSPPVVEWPGGARVAVSICVNYEEASEQSIYFGDSRDEALYEWGYSVPVPPGERNRTVESFTEYGSRVGFWRLLQLFDLFRIKVTFFACALALERNPAAAQAIVAHGHEVCSHGYRWENHYGMTYEQERERVRLAVESLTRTTGTRPIGWYLKDGFTSNTRSILVDEGFLYDSNSYADDLPYYVGVKNREDVIKTHLIVPYSGDINDIRYWLTPGFANGEQYLSALRDTVDVLLGESSLAPKMMSIGLHCRISGRPARSAAIHRFLDYLTTKPNVWLARRDSIARWWIDNVASS